MTVLWSRVCSFSVSLGITHIPQRFSVLAELCRVCKFISDCQGGKGKESSAHRSSLDSLEESSGTKCKTGELLIIISLEGSSSRGLLRGVTQNLKL